MTPTLFAVGAQPVSLARRSRASDRHPTHHYRKHAEEDSVPFSYKKGTLVTAQHNLFPQNQATMPGPIVHNETTATNLGGFVTVLANLTRRAYALEEPTEYVVYQGPMSGEDRQFWATVHIYDRGLSLERPYRFIGRTTSFEPQAIQLAAREAIV